MALLFMDGCDLYGAAVDASEAGWGAVGGSIGIQGGRFGGPGATSGALASTTPGASWERASLPSADNNFIAQFAFRPLSMASTQDVAQFFESTNQAFVIELMPTGNLQFRDAADGILALTPAGTITLGRWHYLEVKLTDIALGNTATAWARLDGVDVVLNIGSVNLTSGSTPVVDRVLFGPMIGRYDDIVLMDGTGVELNDVMGDCRISTLRPNATVGGEVSEDDWVPVPDTDPDDHLAIDDAVPGDHDGDSSYMHSSTNGHDATFEFENLPPNEAGDVYAVGLAIAARYTGASGSLIQRVRSNEVTEAGASHVLGSSYGTARAYFAEDPATGHPWTNAAIDALQAGFVHDGET